MTDKLKKILYWLFMAALLVILFTYWCNNNPYPAAHALKGRFEKLLNYATLSTKGFQDSLDYLKTAMDNDKQAPKELTGIFSSFKTAWTEKSIINGSTCVSLQSRLDKAYELPLSKAYAEASNKAIACAGILAIIGLFLRLAILTALLRDPVSNPAALQSLAQPEALAPMPSFSLARTQLASG